MTRPRDWDAATYERVATPQLEWGRALLDRLPLEGRETVLDAGCGGGGLTLELVKRLPRGRVVAVDASPSMVEQARETLGAEAEVIQADLTELELDGPVDVVFSSAVFHWILDHERLFERLHAALVPGGPLVAQCGGAGNVERFLEHVEKIAARPAFATHFAGWDRPWRFPTAERTAELLEVVGFSEARTWLEPWSVAPDEPREFLRTVCLGPHLERLPEELRERFVDAVSERPDPLELDYVRLNIDARR